MTIKNTLFQASGFNLPKSLLIIPDGNGRWAKHLGLTISEGHQQGGVTMTKILHDFLKINIDVLGVWGFSEDNWKRPSEEINRIMEVIEQVINQNLEILKNNNIKFLVIGKRDKIRTEFPNLVNVIENAEEETKNNNQKTLALFVDYGERFQLEEFAKERAINKDLTTYEILTRINKGIPLFDMILRTSGELRLSGFGPLASLAEFISVTKNLPELSETDILNALKEYSSRQRRFGGR